MHNESEVHDKSNDLKKTPGKSLMSKDKSYMQITVDAVIKEIIKRLKN